MEYSTVCGSGVHSPGTGGRENIAQPWLALTIATLVGRPESGRNCTCGKYRPESHCRTSSATPSFATQVLMSGRRSEQFLGRIPPARLSDRGCRRRRPRLAAHGAIRDSAPAQPFHGGSHQQRRQLVVQCTYALHHGRAPLVPSCCARTTMCCVVSRRDTARGLCVCVCVVSLGPHGSAWRVSHKAVHSSITISCGEAQALLAPGDSCWQRPYRS